MTSFALDLVNVYITTYVVNKIKQFFQALIRCRDRHCRIREFCSLQSGKNHPPRPRELLDFCHASVCPSSCPSSGIGQTALPYLKCVQMFWRDCRVGRLW